MTAKELYLKALVRGGQVPCERNTDGEIVRCSKCCNYVACTMELIAYEMAKEGVLL